MSDLISRQDAIDAVRQYCIDNQIEDGDYHSDGIEYELNNLPSAERKGKWIAYNGDDPNWLRDDGSPVFMQCSECNTMVVNNFASDWSYCPHCGKDMRGKENDE